MYPYYDSFSFFIYMMMGLVFMWSSYIVKPLSTCSSGYNQERLKIGGFVLFFTIVASFRLVTVRGVGGMDAPTYVHYFETCLSEGAVTLYHEHLDIGFQLICKAIRILTSDYHYLFIFLYGTISFSYILFIREFRLKQTNYSPYILLIYAYVLSFSSVRSSFGIALLLLSFILLNRNKVWQAVLLALFSVFIHKACAIYIMAIPFYFVFKKCRIGWKWFAVLAAISFLAGGVLRIWFIRFAQEVDLGGSYGAYARDAMEQSFLEQGYRTAIEQLLFAVMLFICQKRLQRHVSGLSLADKNRFNIVWLICIFDLLLIPVNYMIGNWRSPEFMQVVRIVMWGEMFWLLFKPFNKAISFFLSMVCVSLFVLRMYLSFQGSSVSGGLMPYIFEPFYNLQ